MDAEWLVRTAVGPAWIYNWRPELPPGMVAVEDIADWHVGGQTADVVAHVAEALEASATALRQDPTTGRMVTERIDRAPGRPPHRLMAAAASTGSTVNDDLAEHPLTAEPLFVAGARPDHGEGRNQPFGLCSHPANEVATSPAQSQADLSRRWTAPRTGRVQSGHLVCGSRPSRTRTGCVFSLQAKTLS